MTAARSSVFRFRQYDLDEPNGALTEARFAIAKVILPHAKELLGIAEFSSCVEVGEKAFPPVRQRQRIVLGEILKMNNSEVGLARNAIEDASDGWQASAWKDIALNEVGGATISIVLLIADDDCLQQHRSVRPQKSAARGKEGVEVLVPDRFDHLNRHQLVVLALQVTIILGKHFDFFRQIGIANSLLGHFLLTLGNRRGHDVASELTNRMSLSAQNQPLRGG